jgi:hypothetical protein
VDALGLSASGKEAVGIEYYFMVKVSIQPMLTSMASIELFYSGQKTNSRNGDNSKTDK